MVENANRQFNVRVTDWTSCFGLHLSLTYSALYKCMHYLDTFGIGEISLVWQCCVKPRHPDACICARKLTGTHMRVHALWCSDWRTRFPYCWVGLPPVSCPSTHLCLTLDKWAFICRYQDTLLWAETTSFAFITEKCEASYKRHCIISAAD